MVKQRRIIGDFLKISLPDGRLGYSRVLKNSSVAIYDLVTKQVVDVTEIIKQDVLFIVAVYNDVITSGKWERIGNLPLEGRFKHLPLKFIQDELNLSKFELYNPNTGEIKAAKKIDCIGLERASVWEAQHVEERIIDHYAGKPNIWVEEMKIK